MDDPSPYQPPVVTPPPLVAFHAEPPVVKVFGILHLVLAGVGLSGALLGVAITLLGNPFLKLAGNSPEVRAQVEAQMSIHEKMAPMNIVGGILSIVVAIPMSVAGIKLLKKRRDCLTWSNAYAFTSLGAKAVSLVLAFTLVVPSVNGMMSEVVKGPAAEGAAKMVSGFVSVFAIITILVTCIYPVVALLMLNKPQVKAWAAGLPK